MVMARHQQDELAALRIRAHLESASASIVTFPQLTRENIREALACLEGDRAAQTTLSDILGAARYRVFSTGRLHHAVMRHRAVNRT